MSATNNDNSNTFSLTELLGCKAVTPNGDSISIADWVGKKEIIALYFSAHWCPPCRKFTPKLAAAYAEYKKTVAAEDDTFELVFVSSDSNEEEFKDYHKDMTFPALDYTKSRGAIKEKLDEMFKVDGIPSLVVFDAKTGGRLDSCDEDEDSDKEEKKEDSAVTKKWPLGPRDMVEGYGSLAFPLSETTSKKCMEVANNKQAKALGELLTLPNAILPPKSEDGSEPETHTFGTLLEDYENVSLLLSSNYMMDEIPATVASIMKEINKSSKRLAVVYVPECFNLGEEEENLPTENVKDLFRFQERPSQDIIDMLVGCAGKALSFDSLATVQQSARLLEQCGLDGNCTTTTVLQVELVSLDEYLRNSRQYGAKAFPWTPALIEKAVAEEEALSKATKKKMEESLVGFLLDQAFQGNLIGGNVQERLEALDDKEGLIALLFSKSMGPTSELIKCCQELKTKLEVLYVSPSAKEETFDNALAEMKLGNGTSFLTFTFAMRELRSAIHRAFDGWDNCVVLMRKDGTVLSVEGGAQRAIEESAQYGFPWTNEESVAKGKELLKEEYKKRDEGYEETQKKLGLPVVKKLLGQTRGYEQNAEERTIVSPNFNTYGIPTMVATSGTKSNYDAGLESGVYYEIELLKLEYTCTQMGFCAANALDDVDKETTGEGCGDFQNNWGFCGIRAEAWTNAKPRSVCDYTSWKEGDVIGFAVNAAAGKIAVSTNGSEARVVFHDDKIKEQGVFPCFSIGTSTIRVNATPDTFKYSGPSAEVWSQEI